MMRWDRSKGRPEPIRALNRIDERENHEPLVRLADVAPTVRVPYPRTIAWCRETVARMAEEAARQLPSGVYLAVTDSFRPLARQQRIYEWLTRCAEEAFPGIPYAAKRRKVNRFVAPYDQKAPPGHCTGAALDVMLVNEAGEELDVTSPYSRFLSSPTYTLGLSEEAQRNRSLLVDTLLGVGFSNCRDEWWHYSYGDAGWAVRLGFPVCCYGLVELPESEYAEQQRLWEEAFADRQNPFLEGLGEASNDPTDAADD